MSSLVIALRTFAWCFGAALVWLVLHVKLPGDHLHSDSKDVVKLVLSLIVAIAIEGVP